MSTITLTTAVATAIATTVARYVNAGLSFTALDISRAIQNGDGKTPPVKAPHTSLKDKVHELFGDGDMGNDYIRTLINVPGGRQAYLYHTVNTNPSAYDPTKVQPLPSSVQVAAPVTAASQILGNLGNPLASAIPIVTAVPANVMPVAPSHTAGKPLTTRKAMPDGRLRIPVKAVQSAGLNAGDKAHLFVESGEGEIYTVKPTNRVSRPVTVDQYTNILFNVGKANGGADYDIYVTNGFIKAVLA